MMQSTSEQTSWSPLPSGEIVHEWLAPIGGSENVVDELLLALPEARLTAAWNDAPDRFPTARETVLARTPLRRSKALALPAMPATWRFLGRSDAKWILSSSHLFSHHARFSGAARQAKRLVYLYTPARYIWSPELDSRGTGPGVRLASSLFKGIDRARAQDADSIVAISNYVAKRVEKYWGLDAGVIYPPVESQAIIRELESPTALTPAEQSILEALPSDFVLGASRFIPYKRLEDVISSGAAVDLPVVLAGAGPHLPVLRAMAEASRVPVHFVDAPSTALLRRLYQRATVFIFPALEDFGIMPVEAMATGTGVVALDRGGAAETVQHGITGATVSDFSSGDVVRAVEEAASVSTADCQNAALTYDASLFRDRMRFWVAETLG